MHIGQLWRRKSPSSTTVFNPEWLLILSFANYPHPDSYSRELTLLTEFGNILKWSETNLYGRYNPVDE
jgi:hypothetical protein